MATSLCCVMLVATGPGCEGVMGSWVRSTAFEEDARWAGGARGAAAGGGGGSTGGGAAGGGGVACCAAEAAGMALGIGRAEEAAVAVGGCGGSGGAGVGCRRAAR